MITPEGIKNRRMWMVKTITYETSVVVVPKGAVISDGTLNVS